MNFAKFLILPFFTEHLRTAASVCKGGLSEIIPLTETFLTRKFDKSFVQITLTQTMMLNSLNAKVVII